MSLETFEAYPWGRVCFRELCAQVKTVTEKKLSPDMKPSYVLNGFVQVLQVFLYFHVPSLGDSLGSPIAVEENRTLPPPLLRFRGYKSGLRDISKYFDEVTVTTSLSAREGNPYWIADAQDSKIDNLVNYLREGKPVRDIEWTVSRRRGDNNNKRKTKDNNVEMREDGKRTKKEEGGQGWGIEILAILELLKKSQERKEEKADSRHQAHQAFDQHAQKMMEMARKDRHVLDQTKLQDTNQHTFGVIEEEIVKNRNTDERFNTLLAVQALKERNDPLASHHKTIDFPVRPSNEAETTKTPREPQIDKNAGRANALAYTVKSASIDGDIEQSDGVVVCDDPDSKIETNARLADSLDGEIEDSDCVVQFPDSEAIAAWGRDRRCRMNANIEKKKQNQPPGICHQPMVARSISDVLATWGIDYDKYEGTLESLITFNRGYQDVDAARGLIYGQYDDERLYSFSTFFYERSTEKVKDLLFKMIYDKRWFRDEHMDLVLNLFRVRLQTMPHVFKSQRIAILDVTFQQLWTSKHKEWTATRAIVGGAASFYDGSLPICVIPSQKKRWGDDVDTLYGVLNISNNHWAALVISLTERTVTVYDCLCGNREENSKLAVAFAEMVPHLMSEMDPAGYPVNRPYTVTVLDPDDGIPQMTDPYGDCGVFTLKFLECLMMGVDMEPTMLRTEYMDFFRVKYAVDIYADSPELLS